MPLEHLFLLSIQTMSSYFLPGQKCVIQRKGSHVVYFRWPINRLATSLLANETPRFDMTPFSLDMVHLLRQKTLRHTSSAYYATDARERLHAREKHRQRQIAAEGNI